MRYAVSASAGTLVWAALLACYLQAGCSVAASNDPPLVKSSDDSTQQIESSMSKRDWQKTLPLWGKRAWQSLQGGWGKRDGWGNPLYSLSSDKRAWQNLQGGWGKRFSPEDEYAAMKQLSTLLEQEEQEPQYPEYGTESDIESNEDEKRAWKSLNGVGWGKRAADWASFRGSWGKRDPAWTNLKGIWGKRSYPDRISQ